MEARYFKKEMNSKFFFFFFWEGREGEWSRKDVLAKVWMLSIGVLMKRDTD